MNPEEWKPQGQQEEEEKEEEEEEDSPGEWLNESEEASDKEWREAALLALRVTGPSRTGGCGYTETNININTNMSL